MTTDHLEAARDGDRVALDRLLESIWVDAYRISFGIVQDRELAKDAAQESCAILCTSIGQLRELAMFPTWFYRIVVRAAVRLRKRHPITQSLEQSSILAAPSDTNSIDLQNALARLPLWLRAPIILHYYSGFKSAEIAPILGIAAATVRFRIALAKRYLRPMLEERTPAVTMNEGTHHA